MSDLMPLGLFLLVVAIVIWAAADFFNALTGFINIYLDVRHIKDDIIWFAREVAQHRFGKYREEPKKEGDDEQPPA